MLTGVITNVAGTAGNVVNTFDNLAAFATLLPHTDVYDTNTLSPVAAAVFTLNLTTITLEFTSPESTTAFVVSPPGNGFVPDKLPLNDHTQPVAAADVATVDEGNTGAI
jgi:hypothetical protein